MSLLEILQPLDITLTPDDVLRDETMRIEQSMSLKSVYVQVPTQHPFEMAVKDVSELPAPNSSKYKVFRHLWSTGLFITTGDSFGCDFLTYPGESIVRSTKVISNRNFQAIPFITMRHRSFTSSTHINSSTRSFLSAAAAYRLA